MTDESSHSERIEALVQEFIDRKQRGEAPTIAEYCSRYPALAENIRYVFPTLLMMEDLKPDLDAHETDRGVPAGLERIGDYRILREIGRGGMGVVYEAEQESLGRRVALKVLCARYSQDDKGLERFQREARAAAKMHHTNIVPVFEIGQDSGYVFYAMQLIRGSGLDRVIKDLACLRVDSEARDRTGHHRVAPRAESAEGLELQGPAGIQGNALARSLVAGRFHAETLIEPSSAVTGFDSASDVRDGMPQPADAGISAVLPGETDLTTTGSSSRKYYRSVARIGRQVAEALAYSHARGVVHRDIKPSNLLLDAAGVVWITDFGIAKSDDQDITHTGDIVGTIRYMSPGQHRGRCNELSDIYGLGVTLYELVALKPAFDAPDRLALIQKIKESEPALPRSIDPHIPIDLETIILKAMDKEPASRYQSAEDLAEDLRRFIEDEPIQARRISMPGRLVRWARRNKKLAVSLSAIAMLIIILIVGSLHSTYYYYRQQHEQITLRNAAERNLYFAEMNLAGQAADLPGGRNQIRRITRRWSPETAGVDLRGWEWFFLRSLCQREGLTLGQDPTLPSVGVGEAVWNPDGTLVALAHLNGKLTVWDALVGRRKLTLEGHADQVLGVSWSSDGRTIASGGLDRTVRLWDAASSKTTRVFEVPEGVIRSIAHSPDSTQIAWGCNNSLYVCDLSAGTAPVALTAGPGAIDMVQWSPDGTHIAGGNWWDNRLHIWDVAAQSVVRELPARCVKWSPSGHDVVNWLTSHVWGDIEMWDAATGGRVEKLVGHTSAVLSISWSPDGDYFVSASDDRTFRLWDAASGRMIRVFEGHKADVPSVHWGPDGTRLLSASYDGTAKIWTLKDDVKVLLGKNTTPARDLSWNRDGTQIAAAYSDGTIGIWDAAEARQMARFEGHEDCVHAVDWSPDGKRLASCSYDGTIRIWDMVGSGAPQILRGHKDLVHEVTWSPDGSRLASIGADHNVRVWDALGGRSLKVLAEHTADGHSVRWNPQGSLLASSDAVGTIIIWDATTYQNKCVLQGHSESEAVVCLSWSPDGTRLASASSDATAIIWDVATENPIQELSGHNTIVRSVSWSPDGTRLATGSVDSTVKIWDVGTGSQTLTLLDHNSGVWCVAWSPDGRRLCAASADGTIIVWDATRGYQQNAAWVTGSSIPD